MSDLDIQIDVPDDDDLDSSVRVLSGDIIPPWLKAAAILILGGLAALMIAAFLLGRTSEPTPEPLTTSTTVTSTSVDGPTAMLSRRCHRHCRPQARSGAKCSRLNRRSTSTPSSGD